MSSAVKPMPTSYALRLARRAWHLLHQDSSASIVLADRAVALARASGDRRALAWAHLARGVHLLYFNTPAEAAHALEAGRELFEALGDRAGVILARAGLARSMWRAGRFEDALAEVLPLRDEGLATLRHEQRGVLLNTIAGCYSAQGRSEKAFAYMYQALRDAGPSRGHGYDTVLHCNLSHELLQIGDYAEALRHVDLGLARCGQLVNPRLMAVLLINRVICLTELHRAVEALPDIVRIGDLPADTTGRGVLSAHFETLAIAALRAGETALGADLVAQAAARAPQGLPEERVEYAVAGALLAMQRGRAVDARAALDTVRALADGEGVAGLSLRARGMYFHVLSELLEQGGDATGALVAVRQWQRLQHARSQLASAARYQAAALQTELLRLQQRLDENVAQRRATERARAELAAANVELSRKIDEVQALQDALRRQATHDPLTGLFNRRHLDDTLPAMWALARREAQPLALAIIDLDHFKLVNDHHGHGVGDRLLAAFGRLLSGGLRKSDVACRYGGEEFCVLMPRTGAEAARRKMQALLRRWRTTAFQIDGVTIAGLSFSGGVADSLGAADSPAALLKLADDELLAAKREGRNRVRVGTAGDELVA